MTQSWRGWNPVHPVLSNEVRDNELVEKAGEDPVDRAVEIDDETLSRIRPRPVLGKPPPAIDGPRGNRGKEDKKGKVSGMGNVRINPSWMPINTSTARKLA